MSIENNEPRNIAYRGYWIGITDANTIAHPPGKIWVEHHNQFVAWANSVDEARTLIDDRLRAEREGDIYRRDRVQAITTKVRS